MRANWIFHLTLLAIVSGCATSGVQQPVPPLGAKQTSWTDKMTPPLKALAPKKKPTPVAKSLSPGQDPISLGFASGPATPALYVSMGQLSDQGGNVSHARSMYQKALSLDPKNLDAALGLARLEDREGNLQVALQLYQQAVKEHPEDARALNDLALCHARCGQMQNSLELLDKVVRMKPDKQLYRNNIAKVLIELNHYDTAVSHLSAVYEPAVANYNMAILLQERGRTPEALYFARAALAANPQLTEASTLLASLTGGSPAAEAVASAPTVSSPITVSAPIRSVEPMVERRQIVANDDITPTPYAAADSEVASCSYPSTGAPPMIPRPQAVPAQTALAPVGYEPTLFPPVQ